MKVFLKRHRNVFSKLRRRLSSAKWLLLIITTAMFFLSMYLSSCGGMCDQQGNCVFSVSGASVTTPGGSGNPVTNLVAPTVAPLQQPLTQVQVPTVPALIAQGGGLSPTVAANGNSSSKKGGSSSSKKKKGGNANAAKDPDNDGDANNDNDNDGDGQ